MGVLGKLKESLQSGKIRASPASASADDATRHVWQWLDSPDGTHMKFLDQDFVPNGLFEAMVDTPHAVLDVGCYCGAAGAALKQRWPQARVTGIEPLARAAQIAGGRIDQVFHGTLEDAKPADLGMPEAGFDTIICADVLEHMYNPWSALARLRTMLSNDGALIASIPNARNLGLLLDLACRGRWEYRGAGLLDITHIRFFTRTEIGALFAETGFAIESLAHYLDPRFLALVESPDAATTLQAETLTLEQLTPDDRRELATLQFVIRAAKAG